MFRMPTIGEPESSGDDSVSLTSTVESDGEGKEYEVDCILAEWVEDGRASYLTRWTGYPEVMATWQDIDSFIEGGEVFKTWQDKKVRVSRGYERAFDIDAWEIRRDREIEKTRTRKDRRARKKARMNRQIDSLPSDSEGKGRKPTQTTSKRQAAKPTASESSSSEDDDTPLAVRKKTQEEASRGLWTAEERQAFLMGLQVAKGPYWHEILAQYGRRGSINQLLSRKSRNDLQNQLDAVRKQFTDVGREPPEYMSLPKPQLISEAPTKAPRLEDNGSDDSGTSDDSMLLDIRRKQAAKEPVRVRKSDEARKQRPTPTQGASKLSRSDSSARPPRPNISKKESSPPIQLSSVPRNGKPGGSSCTPKGTSFDAINKASEGERPRPGVVQRSGPPAMLTKQPYSGTARAAAARTSIDEPKLPQRSRTGGVSNGPARLSTTKSKQQTSKLSNKPSGSGIDVTANWGAVAEPKIRRAATLPTRNTADGSKRIGKPFSLSVRNVVLKGRKREPAPNLNGVVLLDPKTGKPPKPLLAPPEPVSVKTTTHQLQKSTADETEDHHAEQPNNVTAKSDDSLFVDNDEFAVEPILDEPAEEGTAGDPDNSGLKTPTPAIASGADFPLNAPIGPRADTEKSIQPLVPPTSQSTLNISPASTLTTTGNAALSIGTHLPADDMSVTLMNNPTWQEKRDLVRNGKAPGGVWGNIKIGPTLKDLGKMQLQGFSWDIKKLLLTNKNRQIPEDMGFDFKSLCTVSEYQNYITDETTQYIGSGYIAPVDEAQESYDSFALLLACHMSAALLFANQFTMVIWPAHSSFWTFLERDLLTVHPGATLRFVLRKPMPQWLADEVDFLAESRYRSPEQYEAFEAKINDTPAQPEDQPINIVFRDMFDIDFNRLIASKGIQKQSPAKNFFLCFQPANCENYEPDETRRQTLYWRCSEEHDLFMEFLQANGTSRETIHSMQDIGSFEITHWHAWDYFVNNVKSGAIIIHHSSGRVDQLRYLAKLLRHQPAINVWMTSLAPMDQETESHSHLVRLFPHGGVICITPSLVLYHPYDALRILRWFRLIHLPSKPVGTWKIAVRPRFRAWLLDIQDLCSEETRRIPFGHPLQVYADLYLEVFILLTRAEEPFGLMVETWDSEVPLPGAPVIAAPYLPRGRKEWESDTFGTAQLDHEAIRWNDDELIQWFSEWAGVHLDEHRKFNVVLGYPKGHDTGDYVTKCYEKGYGYVEHGPDKPGKHEPGLLWERNLLEILPYDEFFKIHNVKDQTSLDKMEVDRRQKLREAASRIKAEAEKERIEARLAAKEGLEALMKMCRDRGGSEEQARAAGRRRLLWKRDEQGTASDKEVEDCAIDMDLVIGNQDGWNHKILTGTPEERTQAKMEQDKELQRLADKERLSGTQERERMWNEEIEMWAARDREKENEKMALDDDDNVSDELSKQIHYKVLALEPELAVKLTGMLIPLGTSVLSAMLQNPAFLSAKVQEAKTLFLSYIQTSEAQQNGEVYRWALELGAYRDAGKWTPGDRRMSGGGEDTPMVGGVSGGEEDGVRDAGRKRAWEGEGEREG